jgi:8-oxo-dGTP pyrophosphatase MutT (NUDIX family)
VTAVGDAPGSDEVPAWLTPLIDAARSVQREHLSPFEPPDDGGRASAVLILLGGSDWQHADVLLIERAHDIRSHAGQVAFPGGRVDPDDAGVVAAALREAVEETGIDPSGVQVLGALPELFLPVTDHIVTPVLAWWKEPSPVAVVDPAEVASVHQVRLADLVDPAHRIQVHHPSGHGGPGFEVAGLFVWGFTAGLLDGLIRIAGWERDWDTSRVRDLPPEEAARSLRDVPAPGDEPR